MTATIESPRSGRIAPQYRRSGGSKGNFEMIAWLFMRLSGVVLVVLPVVLFCFGTILSLRTEAAQQALGVR